MGCTWNWAAPRPLTWHDIAYTPEGGLNWKEICQVELDSFVTETTSLSPTLTLKIVLRSTVSRLSNIDGSKLSVLVPLIASCTQVAYPVPPALHSTAFLRTFQVQGSFQFSKVLIGIPIHAYTYQDTYVFSELTTTVSVHSIVEQASSSEAAIIPAIDLVSSINTQLHSATASFTSISYLIASVDQVSYAEASFFSTEYFTSVVNQNTYIYSAFVGDATLSGGCAQVQRGIKAVLTTTDQEVYIDGSSSQDSYVTLVLNVAQAEYIDSSASQETFIFSDLISELPTKLQSTLSTQESYIFSDLAFKTAGVLNASVYENTYVSVELSYFSNIAIASSIVQVSSSFAEIETNELDAIVTQTISLFCTLDLCTPDSVVEILTMEGDPLSEQWLTADSYEVWSELTETRWLVETTGSMVPTPIWVQETEENWVTFSGYVCSAEVVSWRSQLSNISNAHLEYRLSLRTTQHQLSYISSDLDFKTVLLDSVILQNSYCSVALGEISLSSTNTQLSYIDSSLISPAALLVSSIDQETYLSTVELDIVADFGGTLAELTGVVAILAVDIEYLDSDISQVSVIGSANLSVLQNEVLLYAGIDQESYIFADLIYANYVLAAETSQITYTDALVVEADFMVSEKIQVNSISFAQLLTRVHLITSANQNTSISADFIDKEILGDASCDQFTSTISDLETTGYLSSNISQNHYISIAVLNSDEFVNSSIGQETFEVASLNLTQHISTDRYQVSDIDVYLDVQRQVWLSSSITQISSQFSNIHDNIVFLSWEVTQFDSVFSDLSETDFIAATITQNTYISVAIVGEVEYLDADVFQLSFVSTAVLLEKHPLTSDIVQSTYNYADSGIQLAISATSDQNTFVSSILTLREGIASVSSQYTGVPVAFINEPGGVTSLYSTQSTYVYAQPTLTSYLFSDGSTQLTTVSAALTSPEILYGDVTNETYCIATLVRTTELLSTIDQLSYEGSILDFVTPLVVSVLQVQTISDAELGIGIDVRSYLDQENFSYAIKLFTFVYIDSNIYNTTNATGGLFQESFLSTVIIQTTSIVTHITFREDIYSDTIQVQGVFAQLEWGAILAAQIAQLTSSIGHIRETTLGFVQCPSIVLYEGFTQLIKIYEDSSYLDIEVVEDGHDLKIEVYVQGETLKQPCGKSIEVYYDGYDLKIEIYQDSSSLSIEIYDDGHDLSIINYSCE